MKTTLKKTSAIILFKILGILSIVLLATTYTYANNISVSNISITGQNTTAGTNNAANYSMVKFNLAWENSWRSAALNWDAAWVFVKYRVNGGAWNHCNLNNTGHTAATGSTIDAGLVTPSSAFNITTNPAVGVFIYKNADGNGNVNYQNVQLRWNYGSQGVTDNAILDVQVFAIEMVYVPTGTFAFGDGLNYPITTINTGNATITPSGIGSLGGQAGGYPTGQTAPSSPDFPNGYKAFYCMKYEISQGQYVDFLNTLTYSQQLSRTNHDGSQPITQVGNYALVSKDQFRYTSTNNNNIKVSMASTNLNPATFNSSSIDAQCNWLSRNDISAMLDWSGLRPMTELEYEKACRGTQIPIPNETVWGNNITDSAQHNSWSWSMYIDANKVGQSANSTSNRFNSRGTYYGILDMGNQILENISINNGSNNNSHGNGIIDSIGNASNSDWNNAYSKGFPKIIPIYVMSWHLFGLISNNAESYNSNCNSGGRGVRSTQ